MEFRPCIDIHNGKVKQIIGESLRDTDNQAEENFVSKQDAAYYADMYKKDGLKGGHIIVLNPQGSSYYEASRQQAFAALAAYPDGLQIGGGIHADNAEQFLKKGASHVIVTSYVFSDGKINYKHLERLLHTIGREHIVLDLSCRKKEGEYYVVTDRWQKFTEEKITHSLLDFLKEYADEFLIHAVDVEGKACGIETELAECLGRWGKIPITYAGGVGSFADLENLKQAGQGKLNVTIGSALDIFGGTMAYRDVVKYMEK